MITRDGFGHYQYPAKKKRKLEDLNIRAKKWYTFNILKTRRNKIRETGK